MARRLFLPMVGIPVVLGWSRILGVDAGWYDDAFGTAIREGVRKYASDPANKFETVLGTESFDVNGDTTQPDISFYVTDPAAKGGVGDWVFKEQQSFASK